MGTYCCYEILCGCHEITILLYNIFLWKIKTCKCEFLTINWGQQGKDTERDLHMYLGQSILQAMKHQMIFSFLSKSTIYSNILGFSLYVLQILQNQWVQTCGWEILQEKCVQGLHIRPEACRKLFLLSGDWNQEDKSIVLATDYSARKGWVCNEIFYSWSLELLWLFAR